MTQPSQQKSGHLTEFESAVLATLNTILRNQRVSNILLIRLISKENQTMAEIDDLVTAVENQSTVTDSVVALLDGLVQALKDAVEAGDTVVSGEQIQSVIDAVDANTDRLAEAVDKVPHPEAQ